MGVPFSGRAFPNLGINLSRQISHAHFIHHGANELQSLKIVWHAGCIRQGNLMNTHKSNTYDLIVESESEDKSRSVIEILIYTVFILSAIASIVQAAAQPVVVPGHIVSKDIVCQTGRVC
jgi:hypothetical protein